jgi:hypothetical protein
MRLIVGKMPEGMCPAGQATSPGMSEFAGATGVYLPVIDRHLTLHEQQYGEQDATSISNSITNSVKERCGSTETWERARRQVRAIVPDGAADEQLAARLAADVFLNMHFVLRCSAHAIEGCVKGAWDCDDTAKR